VVLSKHSRFCSSFKKRAPRALDEIRKFAAKAMGTKDVRIDSELNKFIWSNGIRNVPYRVRVQVARKKNDSEDAKDEKYTVVSHVSVETFKNLQTKVVSD
jgi:large subunit ribosomal protein L31e